MTEGTQSQGWDQAEYRCGRCGYHFTSTSRDEYLKLYRAHTGPACLAILGMLSGDQIRYLANDVIRLMAPDQTIRELIHVLEMVATHRDAQGKKTQMGV